MNQLAFDLTPRRSVYQPNSPTSKAAALRVEPSTGTKRWILLVYLRGCGPTGATDEEMQRHAPMNANTQRPRRVELVKDSGHTRKTLGGDDAVVWVAVEFAKALA